MPVCSSAASDFAISTSTTAAWNSRAMSAFRCAVAGSRRAMIETAVLSPEKLMSRSPLSFIGRGTLQMQVREGGQPLGDLKSGDTLGNFALLAEGEHLLSAWAVTDVELAVLERDAFETLRKQKPQAGLKLMMALAQDFADRLRDAKAPLREFLAWQVSKRQVEGGGR